MTNAPRPGDGQHRADRAGPELVDDWAEGEAADATLIRKSVLVPERFAAIFDRHAVALHRYVARRLGPDAADDVVAETFLRAFQRRSGYDMSFPDARPWLFGIATNLIAHRRRSEVRLLRAMARTGIDPAAEPADAGVVDRVVAGSARPELAAALATLSTGDRDVLLLTASGFGYAETARALGVPVGTVSSRLGRARKKLREALGGTNPISGEPDPVGREA
jgi:RNA polymerase sigma-70 factor (ECF subfamily)